MAVTVEDAQGKIIRHLAAGVLGKNPPEPLQPNSLAQSLTWDGKDDFGNIYYRDKKNPGRRWVIYAGDNDGSRTPPDWQLWLRGTIDDLPDKALPPVRKFQQKPTPNLTGTMAAFRPDGALGSGKVRPASTGDYEPWIPE